MGGCRSLRTEPGICTKHWCCEASLLTPLRGSPSPASEHKNLLLPSPPYVHRQTDRQANWVSHSSTSFRGVTKQLWEQETAVGTEMWTLTEGSAILWLSWPKAAAKGLFCHWRVIVKQSFGFHSSALPLLRNLSQCSRRTPGRAEHSLMSFLFPWGRGHFLKGTIAQLGQGRHMVFELCLASDDSVQAFSSFGFMCHHYCWAKSSKFL